MQLKIDFILFIGMIIGLILFSGCVNNIVNEEEGSKESVTTTTTTSPAITETSTITITQHPPLSENCIDSDGGKNYYVKGSVVYSDNPALVDYCKGNDDLFEYFCSGENGMPKGMNITCDRGCKDGACIREDCEDLCKNLGYEHTLGIMSALNCSREIPPDTQAMWKFNCCCYK
jgi:hypothetical protein